MKKHLKVVLVSILSLAFFSTGLYLQHHERFKDSDEQSTFARFLISVNRFWYDLKFKKRAPEAASGVMIAKIDDASLERFGRWPWNRSIYKEIIDYLYELGAEVVAFDAVFSEAEFQERYVKQALTSEVRGRQESLEKELKLTPPQIDGLAANLPVVGDQIFSSAVFQHPKTVLGYFWQDTLRACPLYDPQNKEDLHSADHALSREEAASRGLLHVDSLVDSLGALQSQGISVKGFPSFKMHHNQTRAFVNYCPVTNRSALSANAKYDGYFNAVPDSDGLFRRAALVQGFVAEFVPTTARDFLPKEWFESATFFPSLALQTLVAYWNSPGIEVELKNLDGQSAVQAVAIRRPAGDAVRIETLPDGSIPINFYGSQEATPAPIPEFSLASIGTEINERYSIPNRYGLPHEKPLTGQIIVIGPTALGVYDLRPSPVQGNAPGVYLHAATVSRILNYAHDHNSFVAIKQSPLWLSQLLLWLVGLGLAIWLAQASAVNGGIVTLGFMLVVLFADFWVFEHQAFALDSVTIVFSMVSVALTVLGFKYFTEERDRAFVKQAFEKYVSPDVVGSILKDPKKLNLGGQKRDLSILFCDIRGFTSISERMGAAELAKFMNDYLTPMTDLILDTRGTIDKYMGDAIMAIFGAPIAYDDHAQASVEAALKMLARLEELKIGWRAQGLPPIEIGIGINSGEVSVGNMGSTRIFSYTVMGDSVNLASRLEGINKEYGTRLIVSEFTRNSLGPEFLCRELDRVKVKGKILPVTIFEVLTNTPDPVKIQLVQQFSAALQLYYVQDFSRARALFETLASEDKTADIYVKRCDLWQQSPPPSDWDGAWTMKTK